MSNILLIKMVLITGLASIADICIIITICVLHASPWWLVAVMLFNIWMGALVSSAGKREQVREFFERPPKQRTYNDTSSTRH